ncbi:MAG: nucleotidyl transferase AbiEii/AbiGii toxin family protein [Gammaproteobacteria bacterium]|nr:nucleotidyl transferase AbiEii/AbiGii toxin family protein [Gammaproteobacteria bacterium]MDH5594708.1 nucleotidyl transferase AbiEii/AbiGii toxin family protein [Gammaproteobacteria bacterium]
MTSGLLNISGKVDDQITEVFELVNSILAELKMPYVVVGASARDLVMHYGYGATVQRATEDVDFAIEVSGWKVFDILKSKLGEKGFHTTSAPHRLISPNDMIIDIVPFGGIEDEQASISWPPTEEITMNVLGFKEACDHAQWVRIQDAPEIDIPVATPEGMVLLKMIAWTDRARDLRKKDAKDIAYLLSTYETIPEVKETLYTDTEIIETYDWDITQAAAYLLGQRVSNIANSNTSKTIKALVNEEIKELNMDLLIEEMCTHIGNEFERKSQLVSAFLDGFNS